MEESDSGLYPLLIRNTNIKRKKMTAMMKTQVHGIINKMVEVKQSGGGIDGFNRLCDSITIDQWKDLKKFGEGLARLSKVHIKHHVRLIKK